MTESLKKPVQPAALFPASIFLLLNLLLVFPALVAAGNPVTLAYLRLSTAWQLVLASALALVLAYLMISLSGTILRIFSGESWADSPMFGRGLTRLQRSQLTTLKEREDKALNDQREHEVNAESAEPGNASNERALADDARVRRLQARLERITNLPNRDAYVAPTALGNALNATVVDLWERYRIDMAALWPYQELAIAEQKALVSRLDNEKATLDFLVNLTFVLIIFAGELALLFYWLRTPLSWVPPLLLVAYFVYRAAVLKARGWGDLVQLTFDMHREQLRKALRLRPFAGDKEERATWEAVSAWLLWGGDRPANRFLPADDLPTAAPSPGPTVIASDNVRATIRSAEAEEFVEPQTGVIAQRKSINYLLLVTAGAQPISASGFHNGSLDISRRTIHAALVVADGRVPRIAAPPPAAPSHPGVVAKAALVPTGRATATHDLRWHLAGLAAGDAVALQYQLPIQDVVTIMTDPPATEMKAEIRSGSGVVQLSYRLAFKSGEGTRTLTVRDERRVGLAVIFVSCLVGDEESRELVPQESDQPNEVRWEIEGLSVGTEVYLEYELQGHR